LDINPTFGVFFMAKYDVKFKQEVVQKYLAGGSARGLAKEYRLDHGIRVLF